MAKQEQVQSITLEAGGDLSAGQYAFVAVAADGQIDLAGNGADADGVLQTDPDAAGKAAEMAYAGRVKVIAGGTVASGDKVMSDANGHAIVATGTGNHVLGKCLVGGVDNDLIEVLLISKHVLV